MKSDMCIKTVDEVKKEYNDLKSVWHLLGSNCGIGVLTENSFKKADVFDNIDNVFFNSTKGTTVIKWKDGSISKSTCLVDDHFDPFVGFCIAHTTKGISKKKLKERIARKFKKNNNG